MFAFFNLGPGEIIMLLVLGVVLYGRNLPEVGRKLGHTVANLRRSLNEFKRQIDQDDSIREIRESMHETRRDMDQATKLPRAIANPTSALREFGRETLGSLDPAGNPDNGANDEERQTPHGAEDPHETFPVDPGAPTEGAGADDSTARPTQEADEFAGSDGSDGSGRSGSEEDDQTPPADTERR